MRAFAVVAALVGLAIFAVLYFKKIDGNLVEAMSDPWTLVVVLFPFLPAVVLSFLAERAQARFIDFIQVAHGTADTPAAAASKKKK